MKSVNTDVAYDYIRKRILAGEFPPGHPLLTEMLAAEIKVSRTPIRDALRKLETDGLVTIRAHHGANVKQMNLKEYREMSDLRLALESHAAGLAAKNHTDDDIAEMQYALAAMRALTKKIIAADKEQPPTDAAITPEPGSAPRSIGGQCAAFPAMPGAGFYCTLDDGRESSIIVD